MASTRSQARIEARIVERVAHCCQFEVNDPRASFVTITSCKVSSDLAVATVSYTVMGNAADRSKVAHMLEHATGFFRKQIGRVLKVRRIPALRWMYDESVELQLKMESAIADAMESDRRINPSAHPAPPEAQPEPQEELEEEDPRPSTDGEASNPGT